MLFNIALVRPKRLSCLCQKLLVEAVTKHLDENSQVVEKLTEKEFLKIQAIQVANESYQSIGVALIVQTSGPPYMGVIICLLALIGFVVVKAPLRWGLTGRYSISHIDVMGKIFTRL